MPEEIKQEEEPSLIDRAEAASKDIKSMLEENKQVLAKMEKIRAEELLKGKAAAGAVTEPPKEESAADYARRILGGNRK